MKYVASFGSSEAVYAREETLRYFKEQSDATQIPFIFLSAIGNDVSRNAPFRKRCRFAL